MFMQVSFLEIFRKMLAMVSCREGFSFPEFTGMVIIQLKRVSVDVLIALLLLKEGRGRRIKSPQLDINEFCIKTADPFASEM